MSIEATVAQWQAGRSAIGYWSWQRNGHDWDTAWVGGVWWRFGVEGAPGTVVLDLEVSVHEDDHPIMWMVGKDASGDSRRKVFYEWPEALLAELLTPHHELNCLDFTMALSIFRDECLALIPQMRAEVERHERA